MRDALVVSMSSRTEVINRAVLALWVGEAGTRYATVGHHNFVDVARQGFRGASFMAQQVEGLIMGLRSLTTRKG